LGVQQGVPGAIADAQQAAKLSPHHADAWKLWGDALGRQSLRSNNRRVQGALCIAWLIATISYVTLTSLERISLH
jgi:hypothetical protein